MRSGGRDVGVGWRRGVEEAHRLLGERYAYDPSSSSDISSLLLLVPA